MSWNNPSQDEAADEYYASKSKYNDAANQRAAAMRAADQCSAERAQAQSAIGSCMNEKLNFEKRVEDIKHIIAVLEGTAGGGILAGALGNNIPEVISRFNGSAQEADTSYRESMKCSEIPAASIMDTF